MTGWLKTLDGADVYTEDGEWFWSHEQQGWFHAPGLLVAPPAPPMATRLKDEAHRLTHGWPPLLRAFAIRNGVKGGGFWLGMVYRVILVAMWAQVIFGWGIHKVARSFQKFVYETFFVGVPEYVEGGAWYSTNAEDDRNVVGVLFFLLITAALWYLLYMHLCYTVDNHKGHLLFGGILAHAAWTTHKRHARQRDHRFAQNVAEELDRRHQGGHRW